MRSFNLQTATTILLGGLLDQEVINFNMWHDKSVTSLRISKGLNVIELNLLSKECLMKCIRSNLLSFLSGHNWFVFIIFILISNWNNRVLSFQLQGSINVLEIAHVLSEKSIDQIHWCRVLVSEIGVASRVTIGRLNSANCWRLGVLSVVH